MLSFLRPPTSKINYPDLISTLEKNCKEEVSVLLFESIRTNYLPTTYAMLEKMSRPSDSTDTLKLHKKYIKGKYELAIFEVPWCRSDVKFLPLILDRKLNKIVGVMLPFNELLETLTKNEQRQIHELSMIWTGFILQARFGIEPHNS
jgi:hypothetical protein